MQRAGTPLQLGVSGGAVQAVCRQQCARAGRVKGGVHVEERRVNIAPSKRNTNLFGARLARDTHRAFIRNN